MSSVQLNRANVGRMLQGELGVKEFLEGKAEQALATAKASAPVVSGVYRDSLTVTEDHTDRIVYRLHSTDDAAKANRIEARHGVIGNAIGSIR